MMKIDCEVMNTQLVHIKQVSPVPPQRGVSWIIRSVFISVSDWIPENKEKAAGYPVDKNPVKFVPVAFFEE